MKTQILEMHINYGGADVQVKLYPEEHILGMIYPVELNDKYAFTIYFNEEEEWVMMRENNGFKPVIENELLENILRKLEHDLKNAA